MKYGVLVPQDLVKDGGPQYLVGVISSNPRAEGDKIEFGPLGLGGVGIQTSCTATGRECVTVFTAADIRDIIDGLTQCLEDCNT